MIISGISLGGGTPGTYMSLLAEIAAALVPDSKAIFGYGQAASNTAVTNLVSNTGTVASDTTGVGTARNQPAATTYGGDKALFGFGQEEFSNGSRVNLVSNTGVVATDSSFIGTGRFGLAAASYSA